MQPRRWCRGQGCHSKKRAQLSGGARQPFLRPATVNVGCSPVGVEGSTWGWFPDPESSHLMAQPFSRVSRTPGGSSAAIRPAAGRGRKSVNDLSGGLLTGVASITLSSSLCLSLVAWTYLMQWSWEMPAWCQRGQGSWFAEPSPASATAGCLCEPDVSLYLRPSHSLGRDPPVCRTPLLCPRKIRVPRVSVSGPFILQPSQCDAFPDVLCSGKEPAVTCCPCGTRGTF